MLPQLRYSALASLLVLLALGSSTPASAQAAKEERIELPSQRRKDRQEAFQEKLTERREGPWRGWRKETREGGKGGYRKEGQLIIRYRNGSSGARVRTGLSPRARSRWLTRDAELVQFDESEGYERVRNALLADPAVAGVEPNQRFQRHQIEDAARLPRENRSKQDYLARFRKQGGIHGLRRGKGSVAVQGVRRGKKIHVGILDTGIDPSHPQLAEALGDEFNALWTRPEFLPVPEEEMDSTAMDYNGHGTMVAGIIGARTDEGGIEGLDEESVLHAIKVLDRDGIGDLAGVLAGLRWAIDHRMDIVNMSLGSYQPSPALEDLIREASAAGILLVAAAGNDFADDAAYPAKYPEVIAVGSIEPDNAISGFSNWGADVDLYAPGSDLYTTRSLRGGDAFGVLSGTSASAAYVTGIFSLLMSHGLEGSKAAAAAAATALSVSNSGNPRDVRLPVINEEALFGEVSRRAVRRMALTYFEIKAVPATADGMLEIHFRVQNAGRTRIDKPEAEVEFTSGTWTGTVPFGRIPALRPGEEYAGIVDVPLDRLVPADWKRGSESRIVDYRAGSAQALDRSAKGSFNLHPAGTPMLQIRTVWVSPMKFHESRRDRVVSVLLSNSGSAPLGAVTILPTYWEGTHESVWRSPNHLAGPEVSAGSLEPGESRLVQVPVPDLDSLPYQFTLDLSVSAGGKPVSNYLQSHVYAPDGGFVAQYAQVVHRDLAVQAVELLRMQGIIIPELHSAGSQYLDGGNYRDWNALPSQAKYTSDWWTDSWLATNLPSTLKYTLVNGAHDCDGIDVSSQKYGMDTWDTHFWIVDNNDNDGLSASPSAYNKIVNLMKGGKSGGLLNYGALAHYAAGHKKAAWWFLGHAVHLIGDVSLGSHVNEENAHGVIRNGVGTGDVYHNWMDAGNHTPVNWKSALDMGGYIDPYQSSALGNPLRFLAYTTAQVGNAFPWAHVGDGTDYGKEGNIDLLGSGDRYTAYLSPIMASLNQHPRKLWHINKNEVSDACPGFCCPCADECQLVDVIGSNETSADCHEGADGYKDLDNTDGPPTAPPSNADGDIAKIRNSVYPYAIRAAAGLLYWFALESGQLGYRSVLISNNLLM